MGEDALNRQVQEAKDRWVCCGEPRTGPHHPLCAFFVPPPEQSIEGQETLV